MRANCANASAWCAPTSSNTRWSTASTSNWHADDVYCLLDEFEMAVLAERRDSHALAELARAMVHGIGAGVVSTRRVPASASHSVRAPASPDVHSNRRSWRPGCRRVWQPCMPPLNWRRPRRRPDRFAAADAVARARIAHARALLTTATAADWRVEVPLLPLHSEQIRIAMPLPRCCAIARLPSAALAVPNIWQPRANWGSSKCWIGMP